MLATVLDPGAQPVAGAQLCLSLVGNGTVTARVHVHAGERPVHPSDYTDVSDRIGAVGGHFTLARGDDGYTLTAVIPCG
jgi:hypothetical protein